jgi:hypothetical protein
LLMELESRAWGRTNWWVYLVSPDSVVGPN